MFKNIASSHRDTPNYEKVRFHPTNYVSYLHNYNSFFQTLEKNSEVSKQSDMDACLSLYESLLPQPR